MIRRYCDCCGVETETPTQLVVTHADLNIEITRAVYSRWNDGDVCLQCIFYALQHGRVDNKTNGHMVRPATEVETIP